MYASTATRFGLRSAANASLKTRFNYFANRLPIRPTAYQMPLQKRTFITDGLPTFLVPPAVFTGLLVGLWTYKCIMTVLFQDRIIYMPYMPPFARSEKMEDYTGVCKPVKWRHEQIGSLDGTKIALGIGEIPQVDKIEASNKTKHVVICYFQGNGSSLPPRLPLVSNVLKAIDAKAGGNESVKFTLVALSYRGYWTSSGRASQKGIELDAQAMLRWINSTYSKAGTALEIILWGQSIGAGVAATAAGTYNNSAQQSPITGIVLETPFSGIKSMLLALYPQKWLPYQYLWPFLWNHWDSEAALRRIAEADRKPRILLLPATRDEIVPPSEADKLEAICLEAGLHTERKDIIGALHTEATTRREGQDAVARFVVQCAKLR